MVYRRVLEWPNKSLRAESALSSIEDDQHVYKDLSDTFAVIGGYGLSAPQIGYQVRVIVINESLLTENSGVSKSTIMINPEITKRGEKEKFREACFSLPGCEFEIERFSPITVEYFDGAGEAKKKEFEGYSAACIQHEIDHLDGKLTIDRISQLRRSMWVKKNKKKKLRLLRESRRK